LPSKFIVGTGAALDWAMAAWREVAPELDLVPLSMSTTADPAEVEALLGGRDLAGATAFVTADARYLNFARLERMGLFRMRGLGMPALVCRGAIVSDGAKIGENSYVGPGAIVGQGCKIGFNSMVGARRQPRPGQQHRQLVLDRGWGRGRPRRPHWRSRHTGQRRPGRQRRRDRQAVRDRQAKPDRRRGRGQDLHPRLARAPDGDRRRLNQSGAFRYQ
jgi:hypothetical protein